MNEATANGENDSDTPTKGGEDKVEDKPSEPNPSLKVEKTTTSTPEEGEAYKLGETIEYKIVVTNDGNLTIKNVVVEDEFTDDEWKVETMAPGAVAEFTTSHVVDEDDILAGTVVNEATANGENDSDTPTKDGEDEVDDKPSEPNPHLTIVKSIANIEEEPYKIGDVIEYTFEIINDGNLTITDIVVEDMLYSEANAEGKLTVITLDEGADTLKPGESMEVVGKYTYTVVPEDVLPPYDEEGNDREHFVNNTAVAKGVVELDPTIEAVSEEASAVAELEHKVRIRFFDKVLGDFVAEYYVPYGGSLAEPHPPKDHKGYDFVGYEGGVWENVTTDQHIFLVYKKRSNWHPDLTILDADIPLAGGYISTVGDCFD